MAPAPSGSEPVRRPRNDRFGKAGGLKPEIVQDSLDHIARGAARSGRALSDLDIWWFVKWNLDDAKAAAIHEMSTALTASANHAFRFTLEGKHIPEMYKDHIQQCGP